ncbi:rhamnogalacturonan lyase [Brevundimonas variabilis]|uniref:Rhamnogalacturonan endolyase n=1 Tax=Brevundimonas variabilis TaxID=74312 RepID=A0A7W9CL09_9CAUL|nr:rhamnogalacturonan lyase [Brevundimonas variabilis]MBB5747653.1 rhamnogalacturonan endolyase [Brevundimonas variabilis]
MTLRPTLVAANALILATMVCSNALAQTGTGRQQEDLDRGAVAAPAANGGMLVSWRLRASDAPDLAFDVYRNGQKVNVDPITTSTNLVDPNGQPNDTYDVRIVSEARSEKVQSARAGGYLSIPLMQPPGGTTPAGEAYTYTANDGSVGDLDGDGRYEIVLKWDPTTSKDNAFSGYSGSALLDAYTLDGRRLWRIDLGPNVRAGAHYTQFLVFDFDGDGRSEVVAKTADGTVDGEGVIIGDAAADWRERGGEAPQSDRTGAAVRADGSRYADLTGRILNGPEFLTVFDGRTGRALATEPFTPARDPEHANPTAEQRTARWGDAYGNRSDRYLAGVAFLDGARPSIIMGRGYYARTTVAAWDWRDGRLAQRWMFDTGSADDAFSGQGNHQLSVADLDEDGRDEIVYGSMAIDDDGRGLWSARLFHGDAMHLSDLDPSRPGLEKFGVHESPGRNGGIGSAMLDARTGEILWSTPADRDTGRGVAMDIDPRHPGAEAWASGSDILYDVKGQPIGRRPRQQNFGIWWDGDLLRELLDGTTISKWNWDTQDASPLLTATGAASNNGTKANPVLSADILGDWREELILRAEDNSELRIYLTPHPTDIRMITLMSDPVYRLAVAWQNTAYNQPPHTGFYLGDGMALPAR